MNWRENINKLTSTLASIIVNTIYFVRKLHSEIKAHTDKKFNSQELSAPVTAHKPQIYVREREYFITPPEPRTIKVVQESMDEKLSRVKWF